MSVEDPVFIPVQLGTPRNFNNYRVISPQSAGATVSSLKTILNNTQLTHCANAVVNDGILRALLNKLIYSIKGQRPKFMVKLNEELTEFATDEEKQKLEKEILETDDVKTLKKNTVRINKRCEFSTKIDTLLFNTFTFGRNGLQIFRFPTSQDFPVYGEPRALTPLNSLRIQDVQIDSQTREFEGFVYDYGAEKGKKVIKAIDCIPCFNNNVNLFDNTDYSGLSLVWTVLSLSQSNSVINDEDIPEATKRTWAKFGFVFAGTSKKSVLKKIRETMEASTFLVHNQKDLMAQVEDLARDLMELPNLRTANAKYMSWCLMMPLFLMFEDDANFATAAQAVQAFKVGVVDYYRTWIRGFLEKYWYDPILADHLGITVDEVISQDIKINATFEDLVYDPFADKVDAYVKLKTSGVWDNEKINKELGADDVLQRQKAFAESNQMNQMRVMVANMAQNMANQQRQGLDKEQQQGLKFVPKGQAATGKKPPFGNK